MVAIGQANSEDASSEERIREQVCLTFIEMEKCANLQAKLKDTELERGMLLSKLTANEKIVEDCIALLKERDADLPYLRIKAEEVARFISQLEKKLASSS